MHSTVSHTSPICTAESVSEKLLLLEQLLEIASPAESDDGSEDTPDVPPIDSDDDDGFDNFEQVKKMTQDLSAAENCAKLERATHLLLNLDLEFLDGVEIPAIQVWPVDCLSNFFVMVDWVKLNVVLKF